MNHNITIPCYIECEFDSDLYRKAGKVFSDFGESALNFCNECALIELYEEDGGALFCDFPTGYYLSQNSKKLTEQDLDEYLVMKEKPPKRLPSYFYEGQGKLSKQKLPEVGSFWFGGKVGVVVTGVSQTIIDYKCLSTNSGEGLSVEEFFNVFKRSSKKYIVVNNVWCVAPVEEIRISTYYRVPFRISPVSYSSVNDNRILEIPHFTNLEDCRSYEKALLLGVNNGN